MFITTITIDDDGDDYVYFDDRDDRDDRDDHGDHDDHDDYAFSSRYNEDDDDDQIQ